MRKGSCYGICPSLVKTSACPSLQAPCLQTCHFGSAQVLVVLESDWTYPSPTLNTELMFLRTSCRLGHHRAFPSSPRVSSSMGAHPASQHLARLLLSIHGCLSGSEGELSEWMLKAVQWVLAMEITKERSARKRSTHLSHRWCSQMVWMGLSRGKGPRGNPREQWH